MTITLRSPWLCGLLNATYRMVAGMAIGYTMHLVLWPHEGTVQARAFAMVGALLLACHVLWWKTVRFEPEALAGLRTVRGRSKGPTLQITRAMVVVDTTIVGPRRADVPCPTPPRA